MVAGSEVGAYRLIEPIGEGGMGAVWLAEHIRLGRRAAIKVLHPSFSLRPDIVTRFFNEARAATAIADPGIVQVFDFGNGEDGSAYIVMELLEGVTLAQRLRDRGRLPSADVLRVVRQIAKSLGAAHAAGIVHRDLKPENIFLVPDSEVAGGERPKILDFGIAKLVGDPTTQTQTQAVLGTPAYMSPEQCRGAGRVDQRSDIYSLGCVMFALLAGRPPFVAEGNGELIAMHLVNESPRPSQFTAGIPSAVEALVMRCLAKDPAQRFTSGTELASALGELLGAPSTIGQERSLRAEPPVHAKQTLVAAGRESPTTATEASGPSSTPTTLGAAAGSTGAGAHPPRGRRWRVLALAAVGAVGVGGATTALVVQATGHGRTHAAAVPAPVPPAAPAVPPPPVTAIAVPVPVPPPPVVAPPPAAPATPEQLVAVRMRAVLERFAAWSASHTGAACPAAADLGGDASDPWGHPIKLTCTDQPANQTIGAISAGADGTLGTADDIASWDLPRDVTDLVRGGRWKPKRLQKAPPAPPASAQQSPPSAFDANGMPKERTP